MKKGTYPIYSLVKLHTKEIEDPQNDKKKTEDFKTSKYENNYLVPFGTWSGGRPNAQYYERYQYFYCQCK
jgi:hypothetical protein